MDQSRITQLLKKKGIVGGKGCVQIDLDVDLPFDCAFVDLLLAAALNRGRCAKILRNFMVAFSARLPFRASGRDHLFDPIAICETIRVLEGQAGAADYTRGPFRYEKGPLAGLYKKHFFQADFLMQIIQLEIQREGVGIIYRKLTEHYGKGNCENKRFEEQDARLIADAFVNDAIERRANRRRTSPDGGLTGEHLIYAVTPNGKIYLYVSFHDEDPQTIVDMIRAAKADFPELSGIAPIFD